MLPPPSPPPAKKKQSKKQKKHRLFCFAFVVHKGTSGHIFELVLYMQSEGSNMFSMNLV